MIDYIVANMWQLWLVICLLCLLLELTSGDFFIMCFSIGALITTLLSIAVPNVYVQVVCFAVCSALCILFVRPVMLRYFRHGMESRPSNADALIGQEGTVSESIVAGGYGRVAIDGDDWKAQCADANMSIHVGQRVKVVGRESIIITVTKV